MRQIFLVLALLVGAVSLFAQDSPVATDRQMLHKYVWSTLGFDGAFNATLGSSLDQWKKSPPEWGTNATGYARRWVSEYAESAIGDGAKYAVA